MISRSKVDFKHSRCASIVAFEMPRYMYFFDLIFCGAASQGFKYWDRKLFTVFPHL